MDATILLRITISVWTTLGYFGLQQDEGLRPEGTEMFERAAVSDSNGVITPPGFTDT